ncbi:MAG TPA: maleylpyruvate isomerase N-terminal domain-containing protein, partial [Gemmatimonadales bacterium]
HFPPLHAALIALLRSLEAADWDRPTVAGAWRVRDVAAHLLDIDLRKLAAHRDGHLLAPEGPVEGYPDVLALVHRLNAGGVEYGRRLSPTLLTDLLEVTGRWVNTFVATLDPGATALFAVAWAGEARSDNRFDTARDYTERWHHQMQIRSAVGSRGNPAALLAPRLGAPLFHTAVRVLPHAYRTVDAPEGTAVVLVVTMEPALAWTLRCDAGRWSLHEGEVAGPAARVVAPPDALWRLFFNALPAAQAGASLSLSGPGELLGPLLQARSVMV